MPNFIKPRLTNFPGGFLAGGLVSTAIGFAISPLESDPPKEVEKMVYVRAVPEGLPESPWDLEPPDTSPKIYIKDLSTESLLALIQADKDPAQRTRLVEALSKREGLSRLEWLFDVVGADTQARTTVIYAFLDSGYNRQQAESILAYAKDEKERNRWGSAYADHFPITEYKTAVSFAKANLTGSKKLNAINSIYARIIREKPKTGIGIWLSLPKGAMRESLIGYIVYKKTETNLSPAVEWIDQLDDPKERIVALKYLSIVWITKDINSAIDYGKKIAALPERAAFSEAVVDYYLSVKPQPRSNVVSTIKFAGEFNPQRSIQLVREFNLSPDEQGKRIYEIIRRWAWQDPPAAANEIDSGPYNDYWKKSLRENVIKYWGRKDPKSAMQWVETIPATAERNVAISEIARYWIAKNHIEAAEWIQSLEGGYIHDSALETLIQNHAVSKDLSEALKWALEISDGSKRLRQVSMILEKAKVEDSKNQFFNTIKSSKLSTEEASPLLDLLKQ